MAFRNELKWLNTAFNGTAKALAGWNISGNPVEVLEASQGDAIAGTSSTAFMTPLANESKRSVKSVAYSNPTSGAVTHDCQGKEEIKIVHQNIVTGNITITRTNFSNCEILTVIIPITGANIAITFPSDVRMARYNEVASGDGWYQSTKVLQVSSIAAGDLHEFSLQKAGSIYILRYDGPVRA